LRWRPEQRCERRASEALGPAVASPAAVVMHLSAPDSQSPVALPSPRPPAPAPPPAAKDLVRHLLVVDPKARYSATDVLRHRWVAGGTASARPLSGTYLGISKIQAARTRFRGAVQSVIATMKLAGKLRAGSGAGATPPAAAGAGAMDVDDDGGAGGSAAAATTGAAGR
jgi:hypothetical protein